MRREEREVDAHACPGSAEGIRFARPHSHTWPRFTICTTSGFGIRDLGFGIWDSAPLGFGTRIPRPLLRRVAIVEPGFRRVRVAAHFPEPFAIFREAFDLADPLRALP